MTTTSDARSTLDDWLPDTTVIEDVRRIILTDSQGKIEYDSGAVIVPEQSEFEIVSKSYVAPRIDVGFGEGFRCLVAIGGITSNSQGIARAKYGFAVLWYKVDGSLITVDFTTSCPM